MKRSFGSVWADSAFAGTCIDCGNPGFPTCDACNNRTVRFSAPAPTYDGIGFDYHTNIAGEHVLNGLVERHPGAE